MRMLSKVAGAGAVIVLLAAAAPAGDLPSRLEGHYTHSFANSLVSGERFRSTETMDIVRTGPDAAYVDVHLEFFNGHECNISGVADAKGPALVLKAGDDDLSRCTFTVQPGTGKDRGKLVFGAEEEGCHYYCGARGSLDGSDDFTLAGRRPFTAAQRRKITGADDYKAAVAAHKAGKPAPS